MKTVGLVLYFLFTTFLLDKIKNQDAVYFMWFAFMVGGAWLGINLASKERKPSEKNKKNTLISLFISFAFGFIMLLAERDWGLSKTAFVVLTLFVSTFMPAIVTWIYEKRKEILQKGLDEFSFSGLFGFFGKKFNNETNNIEKKEENE